MQLDDLTVKEAAEFLRVSEKTVYRWIRQGVIPTIKFQGQYRFDRKEIEAWARYKRIGGTAPSTPQNEAQQEQIDLESAVKIGGIHYKIEGDSPDEIFRNMVELFPFAAKMLPDMKEALITDLIEREALVTTGIGNGIALPHPRHPREWGIGAPVVGVFFLERPAEMQAFDGEPVFVLFPILCSTVKGHLIMLSQAGHLLNNPDFREYLRTNPTRTELMTRIANGLPA
ncbi:MAG: helix-turn-helix domain-containing protein [SAR324 cluster bacterium]|nr:helix-turn-helix domain-containing protein [SAR324 cluster bacterium]MCZ6841674.1 helix-turn-helix domain-containing protein [SAR324 cluster bacterium]